MKTIIVLTLCCSFISSRANPLPLEFSNCDDPDVFKAVDTALKKYNGDRATGNQFALYMVMEAKRTVSISGTVYVVRIRLFPSCSQESKHDSKVSSKSVFKNQRNDLQSKILSTMTSRDAYSVLVNSTMCAGELLINERAKEQKISVADTMCLTSPLCFLLSLLGILPLSIISKVCSSMAKPHLLKNLNITLSLEELTSNITKSDIKRGNALKKIVSKHHLIDSSPESQIYLEALGGTLVKQGDRKKKNES